MTITRDGSSLTVHAAAELLGVTSQTLRNWTRGDNRSRGPARRLMAALGVTLSRRNRTAPAMQSPAPSEPAAVLQGHGRGVQKPSPEAGG